MTNLLIALSITVLPRGLDIKIYDLEDQMFRVNLRTYRGFDIQFKVDGRQDPVAISNRLDKELENAHAFG